MLATCKEYNPLKYYNYIYVGLPVLREDGVGHIYYKMVDVDAPGHNDVDFDRRVGSNEN